MMVGTRSLRTTVLRPRRVVSCLLPPVVLGGCGLGDRVGEGAANAGIGLFESVLFFSAILILVILVGGVIALVARRRYKAPDDAPTIGFTLEDLRKMHERGELTLDEYEHARNKMFHRVRGTDAQAPGASVSRVSGRVPPPRSNQGDSEPKQGE